MPFPIDFDGRLYSTLTLRCERVIGPGQQVVYGLGSAEFMPLVEVAA